MYTKSKQTAKRFNIQKAKHFAKSKTISVTVLYKKQDILCYAIFMKVLELAFIYKKHETLRYMTFLNTKSQTLRKKNYNLRYLFKYKNPDTFALRNFHRISEIGGRGGGKIFIYKKQ